MELTHVTVCIESLSRTGAPFADEFLVVTGVIDCLAQANVLAKAGITEEGRDVCELDNGEVVEHNLELLPHFSLTSISHAFFKGKFNAAGFL